MDASPPAQQIEVLQKLLDDLPDEDFQVFADRAAAERAAELAERITAAEAKLGAPLAAEHRAIIERWGALAVVAKPSAWPRPQQFEIRPAWQFAYAVEVFGLAAARALDVVAQAEDHAPAVVAEQKLVPFMHVAGTAHRIGYDQAGRLYEWKRGEEPTPIPTSGVLARVLETLNALRRDTDSIKKNPPKVTAPAAAPARSVDELLAEIRAAETDLETLPAFEGLRELGSRAAAAVPALREMLVAASAYRRASAHAALLSIEGNPSEHARALVEFLGSTESSGAAAATAERAFERLGAEARPYLEAALLHPNTAVRDKAGKLLAR